MCIRMARPAGSLHLAWILPLWGHHPPQQSQPQRLPSPASVHRQNATLAWRQILTSYHSSADPAPGDLSQPGLWNLKRPSHCRPGPRSSAPARSAARQISRQVHQETKPAQARSRPRRPTVKPVRAVNQPRTWWSRRPGPTQSRLCAGLSKNCPLM